jgi:hypothetical protein
MGLVRWRLSPQTSPAPSRRYDRAQDCPPASTKTRAAAPGAGQTRAGHRTSVDVKRHGPPLKRTGGWANQRIELTRPRARRMAVTCRAAHPLDVTPHFDRTSI